MTNNIYRLRNENFVLRDAGEELVMVPLADNIVDMNNLMTLNETAAEIVRKLDGKKTLNEICELIFNEYDVEKEVLECDVLNFIKIALDKNIVEQIKHYR